jgi:hypothetical protein
LDRKKKPEMIEFEHLFGKKVITMQIESEQNRRNKIEKLNIEHGIFRGITVGNMEEEIIDKE